MNTHEDFEEFLRLLGEHEVEFVIVGGYAVAFHGYVRTTQDLDLLYRASDVNIGRLRHTLADFGVPVGEDDMAGFRDPGSVIRMGLPPARIELINAVSGLTFDDIWERRVTGRYGSAKVCFISRGDLLANKRASGRPKDLADVDELGGNRADSVTQWTQ